VEQTRIRPRKLTAIEINTKRAKRVSSVAPRLRIFDFIFVAITVSDMAKSLSAPSLNDIDD
jgi:uncharacterized membrane protein